MRVCYNAFFYGWPHQKAGLKVEGDTKELQFDRFKLGVALSSCLRTA